MIIKNSLIYLSLVLSPYVYTLNYFLHREMIIKNYQVAFKKGQNLTCGRQRKFQFCCRVFVLCQTQKWRKWEQFLTIRVESVNPSHPPLSLTHTPPLSLSLFLSLTHTHLQSVFLLLSLLSYTHITHTPTNSISLSLSVSLSHTHTQTIYRQSPIFSLVTKNIF